MKLIACIVLALTLSKYRILQCGGYQRSNEESTWGQGNTSRDFDRSERYCALGRFSFLARARIDGRCYRENNEEI